MILWATYLLFLLSIFSFKDKQIMNFLIIYFKEAHFKMIQNLIKLIIVINIVHKTFSPSFVLKINLDYQILICNVTNIWPEGIF